MAVRHPKIVNYSGTVTHVHGLWYLAGEYAGRLTLRSRGLKLDGVRPAHVQPVEVPPLTQYRADALRDLARYGHRAQIPTRARTWLIAQGLAELTEEGHPTVTALGGALADAIAAY